MTRRSCFSLLPALATASVLGADGARLKLGQIGTGHSHASGKLAAVLSLAEQWEVVGYTETDVAKLQRAEKSAPYAGLRQLSVDELLATPDLKAVAVETELHESCATALRCIQAGKHVHLDKPGALDHAAFKEMRLLAEQKGLILQMGYMLRYNPAFQLMFQAVKEGWLGQITEIDAAMGKLAPAAMRRTLGQLPGGGMFELACHVIDAVVTLMGKPLKVQAVSTPTQADGFKDNQLALLHYPGATAVIRCNHADPFGGPRRRFNITGTEGSMEIVPLESGELTLSLTQARGRYKKGSQKLTLPVPKGRYDAEFADLARALRSGKGLAWDAAHDIAVHETVLAAAGVA
jgi:predicted dehydrogenase